MFKPIERNYDGIRFESLRRVVDPPFGEFHDGLSAAYYNGEVFSHPWLIEWGYPKEIDFKTMKQESPKDAKSLFDEIHALQDLKRQEKFHQENLKQPESKRIPEEKYNLIRNARGETVRLSEQITTKIAKIRDGVSVVK